QTVTDLRKVLTVHVAANFLALRPTTRKWIVSMYGDVASTSGVAQYYYVENTVVRTYPVVGSIVVYYLKVPADLSGGTDVPIIPARFHNLIVDGAVIRAYEDQDNFQAVQALRQEWTGRLENMRSVLMTESVLPDPDDQASQTVV